MCFDLKRVHFFLCSRHLKEKGFSSPFVLLLYKEQASFGKCISVQSFGVHAFPWTRNMMCFFLSLSFLLCVLSGSKQTEGLQNFSLKKAIAAAASFLCHNSGWEMEVAPKDAETDCTSRTSVTEAACGSLLASASYPLQTTHTTLNGWNHRKFLPF